MFNHKENNRIVMVQHPTDMRQGTNTLYGQMRKVGLNPFNSEINIYAYCSHQVMKLLLWEHESYVMYYMRFE